MSQRGGGGGGGGILRINTGSPPVPQPTTNYEYFISDFLDDCSHMWNTLSNAVMPPAMSSEEKIARQIQEMKEEKKVLEKDLSKVNRDREWCEKKGRDFAMKRDNEAMERQLRNQVRHEKKERFLQGQIDQYDSTLNQITRMKSNHQQTRSRLVVMNETAKLSVNLAEAKMITGRYHNMRMGNEILSEMVEDVLSEEVDDEENDTFNLSDKRRLEELRQRNMELSDSKVLEDIPFIYNINNTNNTNSNNKQLSESEMLIESRLDERKLDQFLLNGTISTTTATTTRK